jgi:hypothetical protein
MLKTLAPIVANASLQDLALLDLPVRRRAARRAL